MKSITDRFELSRSESASTMRSMEGLRGFAVLLVFLVHFDSVIRPWLTKDSKFDALFNALQIIGNNGVDLFFVLSGYLIYGALISRNQSPIDFIKRRITRIYPVFTLVFIIYIIAYYSSPIESKIPTNTQSAIIYILQNFFLLPGIFPIDPLITAAWSLSYEFFYYISIPCIVKIFNLRERTSAWRVRFFLFSSVIFIAACAIFGGHIRLLMFIAGILLWESIQTKKMPVPSNALGVSALALSVVCMLLPTSGTAGLSLKLTLLAAAYFQVGYSCFLHKQGWLSRMFSWTPLRLLGNMSYSYYLLHGFTLKVIFLAVAGLIPADNPPWLYFVLLAPVFITSIIPSAILFLTVEKPLSLRRQSGMPPAGNTAHTMSTALAP